MPTNFAAALVVSATLLFAGAATVIALPGSIATDQSTQVAVLQLR